VTLFSTFSQLRHVRQFEDDLTIEMDRHGECRIQHLGLVRRRRKHNRFVGFDAVHFGQDLVQDFSRLPENRFHR
jgi:hypothetical protein